MTGSPSRRWATPTEGLAFSREAVDSQSLGCVFNRGSSRRRWIVVAEVGMEGDQFLHIPDDVVVQRDG